ncbi:hypothetical protein LEAN103870_02425 [Legionella anisa]|uniref:Uncharacterized protein n=2 Tax=Legionella anisa TaxID=28082 RepID=A0AAX0WU14_9GAMM|nr:hypothetical protein [Legionella anisa]AWN74297.1 hypothetical protein DLD14_10815 [Legionella anisa]KTC72024.1 hypothetical protein Lani_1616 [Legionella anisa]MCW8425667.1 hypothetical protein [Legionella anisa]MCW8448904.1 hypothetical protein [Legionella anisa]PNL61807.1 hypothetical protein A6J39_011635 [Legionella anisa]
MSFYALIAGNEENSPMNLKKRTLFYNIDPFRKNIIEQKLNEELEKRLSLETFLEPFRKNQQRKGLAGLMMLHRDEFVTPIPVSATQNQQRFFAMTRQLPQELYGLVTKAAVDSKKEILTDKEIIDGAEKMLLQF